jgi:phosphoglycerate transporter family protein
MMIATNDVQPKVSSSNSLEVNKAYAYWRFRILATLIIGYASFYIVRQNFSMAVPRILEEFNYSRTKIGWIFSAFSIIYGVSKFVSGSICDRSNARYFMAAGLFAASIVNLFMGFTNSIVTLGILYAANGFFQSMGWPPCTRLLTHWYGPKELGTRWGICNSSHQIGSVIILSGGGWLLMHYSWRSVFIIPSIIGIVMSLLILERLRDTPMSLGLPSIEEKEGLLKHKEAEKLEAKATYKEIFLEHILPNKPLWFVCVANFFVYYVRMGFFSWAPTFLHQAKGVSLTVAGAHVSILEIGGLAGGIIAGVLSDKIFGGRRGIVGFYYMMALTGAIALFTFTANNSPVAGSLLMLMIGFLVYGPQVLVGVAGAEFGSKKAAAAAAGLTGTIGYLGGALAGVGAGYLTDTWGWKATFLSFIGAAFLGALSFVPIWNNTAASKASKE